MSHPNIATALLAARNEFPPIHKTKPVKVRTKSGAEYTFMYAPHDAINDVTVPVLGKHGLTMVQPLSNLNGHPAIRTVLLHESGESIEDTFPLPLRPDMTAQEVGSAITYVRRYAWVSMLGLVADEDDDGNHASGNSVKAGASPSSAPQGQATDAAVSRNETPAPAAASPAEQIVGKAQVAAENLRANQRPDIPVALGDNKFQVTTFVERVDGPNDKGWHDIYVLIEGKSEKLSTKLKGLHQKAFDLQQTTAVVTYKETQNGNYVNRYLDSIEPAPELAETFAGIPILSGGPVGDIDIPFGPVIW